MSDFFSIPANSIINFEIKGYCTDSHDCVSDANWLRALIRLSSKTITSEVDAFVTTHDLHTFLKELKDGLAQKTEKATFATDEDAVLIEVYFDGNDEARIVGYLKEIDETSLKTYFELKVDQGGLARAVENLSSLLEIYPVITRL